MRELTPARSIMSVVGRRRKRQVRLLGNSRPKRIESRPTRRGYARANVSLEAVQDWLAVHNFELVRHPAPVPRPLNMAPAIGAG